MCFLIDVIETNGRMVMTMSFDSHAIVHLKNDSWLERQRVAGKCVGRILAHLNRLICDVTPNITLKDLEAEAIRILQEGGCTATFLGYKGFPGAVCLSVNKQLVHGIPSDYVLQQGDVVKFDLGATYEGAIADAAATAIYGEPKLKQHVEMINICREALNQAINAIKVGNRLGSIGYAIHRYVNRMGNYGLITDYGGHGIDENRPHAAPFVANKARPDTGIRIQPGLSIAIEPMLTMHDTRTRKLLDGWTIVTDDIGCHFEHSVFVNSDGVEIITTW